VAFSFLGAAVSTVLMVAYKVYVSLDTAPSVANPLFETVAEMLVASAVGAALFASAALIRNRILNS
jgi:hypothetical protein